MEDRFADHFLGKEPQGQVGELILIIIRIVIRHIKGDALLQGFDVFSSFCGDEDTFRNPLRQQSLQGLMIAVRSQIALIKYCQDGTAQVLDQRQNLGIVIAGKARYLGHKDQEIHIAKAIRDDAGHLFLHLVARLQVARSVDEDYLMLRGIPDTLHGIASGLWFRRCDG